MADLYDLAREIAKLRDPVARFSAALPPPSARLPPPSVAKIDDLLLQIRALALPPERLPPERLPPERLPPEREAQVTLDSLVQQVRELTARLPT